LQSSNDISTASLNVFERALSNSLNTDQAGCLNNNIFYGGNHGEEDACNNNGHRYSLWLVFLFLNYIYNKN
jgi:hypothetical protein